MKVARVMLMAELSLRAATRNNLWHLLQLSSLDVTGDQSGKLKVAL